MITIVIKTVILHIDYGIPWKDFLDAEDEDVLEARERERSRVGRIRREQ